MSAFAELSFPGFSVHISCRVEPPHLRFAGPGHLAIRIPHWQMLFVLMYSGYKLTSPVYGCCVFRFWASPDRSL